jgi:hypothetical protein
MKATRDTGNSWPPAKPYEPDSKRTVFLLVLATIAMIAIGTAALMYLARPLFNPITQPALQGTQQSESRR